MPGRLLRRSLWGIREPGFAGPGPADRRGLRRGCTHTEAGGAAWLVLLWLLCRRIAPALLLCAWPVEANSADVQLLQSRGGGPLLAVHNADPGPRGSGRVALTLGHAANAVTIRTPESRDALLPFLWTTEVGGSFAVRDWIGVGASTQAHHATWNNQATTVGLGDTSVWAVVREPASGYAIRALVERTAAQPISLLGQSAVVMSLARAIEHPWGDVGWHVAARLQSKDELPGTTVGNRLEAAVGVAPQLRPWLHGDVEVLGTMPLGVPHSMRDLPLEVLTGARLRASEGVDFRLAVGAGITRGLGTPSYRAVGGVVFQGHEPRDRDSDGRVNLLDLCPDRPEDHDRFRSFDACPDPDNDRDSIMDTRDRCPMDAEVFNDFLDADGCPDALATWRVSISPRHDSRVSVHWAGESDAWLPGDSFARALHPGVHELVAEAPGHHTLHLRVFLDEGEQRADVLRLEPIQWGSLRVIVVDGDGHPIRGAEILVADQRITTDGDGMWAGTVAAGTAELTVRADNYVEAAVTSDIFPGARSELRVVLERRRVRLVLGQLDISGQAAFDTDEDVLGPGDEQWLSELAAWLRQHSEIRLVRVEGHADALGSSSYNFELSERRARAVQRALVHRGIDPKRLQAVGSGEAETWSGAFRRVSFTVLVTDESGPPQGPAESGPM